MVLASFWPRGLWLALGFPYLELELVCLFEWRRVNLGRGRLKDEDHKPWHFPLSILAKESGLNQTSHNATQEEI